MTESRPNGAVLLWWVQALRINVDIGLSKDEICCSRGGPAAHLGLKTKDHTGLHGRSK